MSTYDQIIFDELAQRRPVMLDDVGYLQVDTLPARISKGRSVSAPRSVVVFTSMAPDNARNVVDIMTDSGVENHVAREEYDKWLAQSRKLGGLIISGAGSLSDGIFTPTEELNKALNPNSQGTVVIKPRSTAWIWILVAIAVLAALIAICITFWDDMGIGGKKKVTAPKTVVEQPVKSKEPAAPVVEQPDANTTTAPAKSSQKDGLGFPVEGMHYVVGGVFDIPANADRYVAYIKRTFPDLTPEKFSYPGIRPGRTMVTVFSSSKRSEALKIRRQLAWNYDLYEYWLFPEEK